MSTQINKPSIIEYAHLKFMIMEAPKDHNLHLYLKECKRHNVQHIVRISPPSYSRDEVEKAGIGLHEMEFADGASPPQEIIMQWLAVVSQTFDGAKNVAPSEKPSIAIHCVAGLGRAPVLVAIALIEHGMDAISAVTMIREKRRGAINAVQLGYLEMYRPMGKQGGCSIM
jgi:protein tyrosine phosphatase type 4A